MIDDANQFLTSLEGARLQGGPVVYANKGLIDWGDAKKVKEEEFDQQDDDELRALEDIVQGA